MNLRRMVIALLGLVLVLFILWLSYKGRLFESLFGGVYRIFFSVESHLAQRTKEFFSSYFFLVDLRKENQQLKEENLALKQRLAEAHDAVRLCSEYERFLKATSSIKHPKVPARIIYKAIDPFSDFILIDRGSKDGVQPQMPVLAFFGNEAIGLIGQVIEVYPNFSKVMLISDPSFAVDVKVVRTGDRAIVRGKGEPILSVEYLPLYSQAQPKDIVVTSGQDALFPANLIIGEVISVSKSPQGLFKQGEVRPYVDVYNLNWVAVILQIPEIPL